jgi:hypothetical protein
VRARPVTPALLVDEIVGRARARLAAASPGSRLTLAVDGPPAVDPGALADALVDPLRVAGHPTLRVRADDFLRPASLRFEFGRTNPDAYYESWLDEPGLRREVLDPVKPGGGGRVLPALWNAATDRATRADYVSLPPGGVVLVSGHFLLGALPFDLTVHLAVSPAALRRRTPAAQAWTLPAFDRYAEEVAPASFADLVVRMDDPQRPAIVVPDR